MQKCPGLFPGPGAAIAVDHQNNIYVILASLRPMASQGPSALIQRLSKHLAARLHWRRWTCRKARRKFPTFAASKQNKSIGNLTTLAPDIVAAILDETLPSEVTLFDLASGTPLLWDEQRALIQSVCRVVSSAEPDD